MDEIFPPAHRQVFPYFDGREDRFGDPLAIDAAYQAAMAEQDLAKVEADLQSDHLPTRRRAVDQFTIAIRIAFELTPFDKRTGSGMSEGQLYALATRFRAWQRALATRFRAWSEHAFTYGRWPGIGPHPPDDVAAGQRAYLIFLGEYLNRGRVQSLRAVAAFQVHRAIERDCPDPTMIDAIVAVPAQIPGALFRAQGEAMDRVERQRMAEGRA